MTIHALRPSLDLYCRACRIRGYERIDLPSNPMRVIAGTYRSRQLIAPSGLATRPTSDRLRETLFNVLAPRIDGTVFVDLYAGSGAVGIEALSRGASLVYFVDKAPSAMAAIRSNFAALNIHSGFRLESSSVSSALGRLSAAGLIFLDPPYEAASEYERTLSTIGQNADSLLTPDGIVVAEHSRKARPAEHYDALQRYRVLEQGDAGLSFYSR
jgi:16S rRNA (guanine966-N2)-methyltransferase